MRIADRMQNLGTENAFEVLQRIQSFSPERQKNIISFAIGEPDFDTPEHIKQAGIQAIRDNQTHYSPSAGIPPLREAIARYAGEVRNLNFTPNNVTVFSSAKMVISVSLLTCVNPGEEVFYPNISSQSLDLRSRAQASPCGFNNNSHRVDKVNCWPSKVFHSRVHIHDQDFVFTEKQVCE